MSRKITVRVTARRPGDAPSLMKSLAAAVPEDFDADIQISCEPAVRAPRNPVRKDEVLETKVNAASSAKLDRLEELAKAAEEYKRDELSKIQAAAAKRVKKRRNIAAWINDMAKAGWVTVIKIMTETLLKGGSLQ